MKDEKNGVKTPDISAKNIMDFIIAQTFERHANLSSEEYLKRIGFDKSGKDEKTAVRIAIFNVITELTAQLLKGEETLKTINDVCRLALNGEDKKEAKKGE